MASFPLIFTRRIAVLHILGAGFANPRACIDNKFLAEIGLGSVVTEFQMSSGIVTRGTILPLDYIRETKNQNPHEASKVATESPTDLAFAAATMALERAGITPQQISCIIGESSTPFQSTPSEAQRVGEKLGIKVPAYDVAASAGPIPLHLHLLNQLRPEKVPEYCLCIVTHAPTTRANYADGIGAFFLGDGAAALVVSAKHTGKFGVIDAEFQNDLQAMGTLQFDSYVHANFDRKTLSVLTEMQKKTLSDAMKRCSARPESLKIIANEVGSTLANQEINGVHLSAAMLLSEHRESGFTLSSGPVAELARNWGKFKAGETIICTYAGAGLSYGNAILKVMEG